jgi:hypothetical protein
MQAAVRFTPNKNSRTKMGIAAARDERARLLATGV